MHEQSEAERLSTQLAAQFEREGWSWRAVSADRVSELWAEIEERHRAGAFDEAFFEERLTPFARHCGSPPEGMRTLLVLAIPDPWVRVRFTWRAREHEAWVPPTFLGWREAETRAVEVVREACDGTSRRVVSAPVPKKLLAARSGLARYGRNNVTYHPEHGSYVRLVSLYTDLPLPEDAWEEAQLLSICERCECCVRVCPTEALSGDRFLVHAERCLTFWNEKPRDVPFPEEIEPTIHHCLVGCARCQQACPVNRGKRWNRDAGSPLSEDETRELLRATDEASLSPALRQALRSRGLLDYLEMLPRNLAALLACETQT